MSREWAWKISHSTSQHNWIYLLCLEAEWALQNPNKKGRGEADSDGRVWPCVCWELWECPTGLSCSSTGSSSSVPMAQGCVRGEHRQQGLWQGLESSSVGAPRCGEIPAKISSAGGLHRPSKRCAASWNVAAVLITTWILQVYPFVIIKNSL